MATITIKVKQGGVALANAKVILGDIVAEETYLFAI